MPCCLREVAVKILSQLVLGVICAGICAGQERTSVGAGAAEAGEAKNIVEGQVVQEPGGQGIRKVKVDLMGGPGGRQHYEAATDETGQFKVLDVEPGTYVVRLERSGYTVGGK